jgi:adenylate cyclase
MKSNTIRYEREREYPISVGEAWRLLADTDHLNRAIGLPSVEFSPLDPDAGTFVREASARTLGGAVRLRWKEYPFEWVRDRRYLVRREFEGGPIAALEGVVELEPAPGGVRVRVYADFTPANLGGRVLWRVGKGSVENMAAFCDRYLTRRAAGKADAAPVPARRPRVDERRLDQLLDRLRQAPVDHALLGPLRERILEGSDDQPLRIRPYALADTWGADRHDVLSLLLHATRRGLFELRWELMCPNCRVPKEQTNTLSRLPVQFHCDVCGIDIATELDSRVELRFSVHPAVREAEQTVYCIGGPLRTPHVVAQQYLRPNESRLLPVAITEPLHLRAIGSQQRLELQPDEAARKSPEEVAITYAEGRWQGPHSRMQGEDVLRVPREAPLRLRNQSGGPLLVALEERQWAHDATTAVEATSLQEFRDLFSSEVLAPGQQLAVQDLAILFSDLRGSSSLYERVGDAPAYSRVNRHFDFVAEKFGAFSGTTVKTIGDGVMGAFLRLEDALAAATAIQTDIAGWCGQQGIDPPLVLKIGIHHGPVIAMNGNGRLDYFGRTVNLAARLGEKGKGGDLVLLRQVVDEATALEVGDLGRYPQEPFRVALRGFLGDQELVRIQIA